jgi:uncharacterized protein involved in outer membrane biogenesis
MSGTKAKRILVRVLKITGWFIFSVIALLLLIALSIQIPWVQQKIKDKAISFLEEKIQTEVRLEHFSLSFPKKIVLTGLYLEDQNKDTLLYAGRLGIDTDLWALTKHKIELKDIELEQVTARVSRPATDSAFNFDYILKAFAGDSTSTKPDTVATPWEFALGDILLEDINASLDDKFSGNHIRFRLNELDILMDEFDLKNSSIALNEINVKGLTTSIRQTRIPEVVPDSVEIVPEDSAAVAFNIDFNEISLEAIDVTYEHTALGNMMHAIIPEGEIEANQIDIKKQIIDLARIMMKDASIQVQQMPVERPDADTVVAEHNENQNAWSVAVDELDLSNNSIQLYDYGKPFVSEAVDFNHLWVRKLNVNARKLRMFKDDLQAAIDHVSFRERSGFEIRKFRTNLALNGTSFTVNNFLLRTGNSNVVMKAQATFASLENLKDEYADAMVNVDLERSTLSLRDALYFQP